MIFDHNYVKNNAAYFNAFITFMQCAELVYYSKNNKIAQKTYLNKTVSSLDYNPQYILFIANIVVHDAQFGYKRSER